MRCRRMRGRECEELCAEDAAAVGLYTFDFWWNEDYERNQYRVINKMEGGWACASHTEDPVDAVPVRGHGFVQRRGDRRMR